MAFTRPKASQINFDVTNITDPLIRLNSGESGSADKDAGLVIERGSDTNAAIIYDESANEFVVINTNETGTTSGNVTIVSYAPLQVSTFKSSGVTMTGAIAMGTNKITGMGDPTANQDAATKAYVDSQSSSGSIAEVIAGTGLSGGGSSGTVTLNIDSTVATLSDISSSLTSLNGSNISSGTVAAERVATLNQNTTGSAATLTTARAIALTGAVTGTANFDGSAGISIATTATSDPTITLAGDLSGSATLTNLGNATLTATIAANSVALSTDTTGNYVAAGATSGSGISGSVSSEGGTFTVTSNATNSNTGSTIVFRDSSGNFSANVISATTTSARYADLAEKYISDADYEEGTVLVFGGDEEVTECTRKYDKRIAGIVSTDPAYLMNSEGEGVTVALLGRVPCKVIGEIRKGDLMVASDIPGHAEAWRDESNPYIGSVIGKALENKTGASVDVIEVVVGRT